MYTLKFIFLARVCQPNLKFLIIHFVFQILKSSFPYSISEQMKKAAVTINRPIYGHSVCNSFGNLYFAYLLF